MTPEQRTFLTRRFRDSIGQQPDLKVLKAMLQRLQPQFVTATAPSQTVYSLGYSFNLDGTTLYLSLAAVFCAQVVNHPIPLSTQIVMLLTLMLTSKGVAGVPRASLVVLSGTIATFGIPPEGIGLILGVDAFMDMARTSVNVLGNCLASAVVGRWEGVGYKTDLEDAEVVHPHAEEVVA